MPSPVAQTGAGNVTHAVASTGTTIAVAKPSNTADGDLLVFVVGQQNNTGGTDFTVPTVAAGTVVRGGPAYNVTGDGNRRPSGIFLLPVPSASALTDTTFTFTATTGSGRTAATCFRVTAAYLASPVDSAGAWYTPSNTASQARALPGVTTLTNNTLLLSCCWWNLNAALPDTDTWTAPASAVDDVCTISSGTVAHSTLAVAADPITTAGATGTRTVTISGSGTVANGAGYVLAIASTAPAPIQLTARVIAHRSTTAAAADTTEEQLTGIAVLNALSPRVNGGEVDVRRPSDWSTTGKSFLLHDTTFDRTSPNGSTGTATTADTATYTAAQICELKTWLDGWIGQPFIELLVQFEIDVQAQMVDPINQCLAHPLKSRITIMTSATAGSVPRADRIRAAGWTGKIGCYGMSAANYATYGSQLATASTDLLFLSEGDAGYTADQAQVSVYHGAGYRVGASTITMPLVPTAVSDGIDVILTDYSEQFTTYLPPANLGAIVSGAQELQAAMNRLAGTTTLDAQGAANVWAGTTGRDLVGALNAKATARGYTGPPLELDGVLNNLAGTVGWGINAAAGAIV